MVLARMDATTAATSDTSPAIAHPATKAEVAAVGVAVVVVEAGEEGATI